MFEDMQTRAVSSGAVVSAGQCLIGRTTSGSAGNAAAEPMYPVAREGERLTARFFQSIERFLGPGKFTREQRQSDGNGHPAGARQREHRDTGKEQRKSCDSSGDALHMSHRRSCRNAGSIANRVPAVVVASMTAGLLTAGCASHAVHLRSLASPPCARATRSVAWVGPASSEHADDIRAWCESVGPPVLRAPRVAPKDGSLRSRRGLVVVSWNVHEGAGDIIRIVDSLRPADVVLLVQEAMREGTEVPASTPPGMRAPRHQSAGRTLIADIVDAADALGLWLAYVPSMQNGDGTHQDRGCAILSTLPLSDPVAIQLPWVAQRRVAVMATIVRDGSAQRIRIVSTHLDNRPGRAKQSAALAAWLVEQRNEASLIVGGDLNTWFGAGEETVRQLDRVVPLVAACDGRPTFRFRRRLDHLFSSTGNITDCHVDASTYGSDHHPIVMRIENR